jgi:hypothetical protein
MRVFPQALPFLIAGLTACGSSPAQTGAQPTAAATVESTAATIVESTATTSVKSNAVTDEASHPTLSFTFAELDGLIPVDDPHVTDGIVSDEITTTWTSTHGVTDAYLVVRDIAANPNIDSPEGDMTATPIDVPSGRAWLLTDNGVPEPPPSSATHIVWWRDDGRLWNVSNYGLTPDRLTTMTLAIESDEAGTLMLADPSMNFLGTNQLDAYQSISQSWTLDGHNLILAVTNGGLTQHLSDLPTTSITEHVIAGRDGYKVTRTNGQVELIWPTEDPLWWASVTMQPSLAERADEIGNAVVLT